MCFKSKKTLIKFTLLKMDNLWYTEFLISILNSQFTFYIPNFLQLRKKIDIFNENQKEKNTIATNTIF